MTQADPHWAVAWDWVQREYDHENFDATAREAMTRWLLADDAHRAAYDKAARLWLLAGLAAPLNGLQETAPQHERSNTQD